MPDLKKILIIDNDLVIRYTLKKIFSNYLSSNLKIYTSSDGLQGLGYVYVVRPDLIIIDSTLPKYSGRELTEYIRTNETLKTTPVILLNEGKEKLENIPENFIQVSKSDNNFPSNLVNIVSKILNKDSSHETLDASQENTKLQITNYKLEEVSDQRPETSDPRHLLVNFLAKKILSYSNISDVESQKVLSRNILVKSIYYIKYLFDQFLTSIYLTFFYVFVGKKDYEETIDQKQRDVEKFRVKTFPALAFALALVFFGILQVLMLSGVFVALTYVATAPAYAASYIWDGGGTDGTCGGNAGDGNKWSCAANWSSDIVPTAADSVTFNSTSTKDATIDASFGGTVTSLTIATGYSGTITVSRSFTMSTSFSQATGTFNGTNQTVTDSGDYTLSGGTFTASSTTLNIAGNITISGSPTFNHNGGTLNLPDGGAGTKTLVCNSVVFNLVTITNLDGTKSVTTNCNLPLGNSPTVTGRIAISGGGTLTGTGTFTSSYGGSGAFALGSGGSMSGFTGFVGNRMDISGTVDFSSYTTFTVSGAVTITAGTVSFPTGTDLNGGLTISGGTFNAPSGNMNLDGSLTISGSTVFNANSGTITIDGAAVSAFSCNNVTFNLVVFNHTANTKTVNSNCSLPLGNNPSIPRAVILKGTFSGTGTLSTSAAAVFTADTTVAFSGFSGYSFGSITIQGNPTLDFSAATSFTGGAVTITNGTVTAPNVGMTLTTLVINGGTFNPGSGTYNFNGVGGTLTCNNVTFASVILSHSASTVKTINSNCSLPLGNNPTITGGILLNGTISGTGTMSLTGSGASTINSGSTISGFSGLVTTAGGFSVAGATFNAGSYTTFTIGNTFTLSSGSVTLPNNADLNSTLTISGGTFNAPSGSMTLAGALTISGSPTFNHSNGTFIFDSATSGTLSCNNVTFNLVQFAHPSGGKTISSNCTLPLGNNPNIGSGTAQITVNGTLSGTGTFTTFGMATLNTGGALSGFSGFAGGSASGVSLTVAGATADFSTYTSFTTAGSITLSSGSLTVPSGSSITSTNGLTVSGGTFTSTGNFTNAGPLILSGGTFNAPNGNMRIAGALTISGSPTFNHNNGTITFDGTTSTILSCNNVTFNSVVFSHSGGSLKTVNSNCNLPLGNNPTIGVTSAAMTLNGTLTGTGTLSTTNGLLQLNAGATLSGFNALNTTTMTVAGATLDLGSYTTYTNSSTLTISSGSLTLPSGADLNGPLTISGGTFTAPSGNMTLAGALTISGSPTFNANSGTITFDGTGDTTLACNSVTFSKVVFANTSTGTKTISNNCTMPLGNNPTLTGRVTLNGTGSSINGTGTFTNTCALSGCLTINNGTFSGFSGFVVSGGVSVTGSALNLSSYNPVVINGDGTTSALTISGSGVFTAPSGTMKLADKFSNTGTFNHNNGTVEFITTSDDVSVGFVTTNATTFNNLIITNIVNGTTFTFQPSITINVLGTLTMKGSAGKLISLISSTPGSQWNINPAAVDIAYLDVKDSNNTGSSVIQAAGKNITNSGNNTRWNFDNPSISSVAPIYLTNGSNIANNKPAYTFNITDPQALDTVKYQIQIDNNSDFTSPEVDYTSALQAQGAATYTVGQLVGSGTYTVGSENQSLADATYYVRIKGIDSTGGDGGYSTVNGTGSAFTVDTTKPTGSALFAYKTDSTSRDIYLILTATDNLSGVDKMMTSENSNFANAIFEEYKTSKAYTVSEGYGQKTIYVKFRDRAGNESVSYIVTPNYSQVVVTPSTTPVVTQVPVSYGTPIGGNLTDGLSVLALRVIGSTNAPLANVSINIPSLGINTTTDENGLIVLQNVPLGSYDVLGLFNNKEFNQNLDVSGDQSVITIKLEDTPNTLTIIFAIGFMLLTIILVILFGYIYLKRQKNDK